MPRITALPEISTPLSPDFEIPLHNTDSGDTEKITLGELTGFPDFGWTAAVETWTYASWSATYRIAVINVPSDATTKYTKRNRIRITQSTGGTKYGIIVAVSATTLTVFFPSGVTFNNETITDPMYSVVDSPFGFDSNPALWELTTSLTGATRTTTSTSFTSMTDAVTVPIGCWHFIYDDTLQLSAAVTTSFVAALTWTSDNATVTNPKLTAHLYMRLTAAASGNHGENVHLEDIIDVAANTTFTMYGRTNNASVTLTANRAAEPTGMTRIARVTLRCAYLQEVIKMAKKTKLKIEKKDGGYYFPTLDIHVVADNEKHAKQLLKEYYGIELE